MHLWPSLRIRDSFKHAYIEKLEWNLQRMKRSRQSQDSPLLSSKGDQASQSDPNPTKFIGFLDFFRDLLVLLSCCCCCFCCGACNNEEEDSPRH